MMQSMQSQFFTYAKGGLPCLAALTLFAGSLDARNDSKPGPAPLPHPGLIAYPISAQEHHDHELVVPIYRQALEVAISTESFHIGYRENTPSQDGFWDMELLVNDDDDLALNARLMRVGQVAGTPLRLGVGVAGYAAFFDESGEKLYALALSGSAQYDLPTNPPTTASLELAIAPDITTIKDGESVFDLRLRLETQVNANAVAFVGLRIFDAETISDDTFTHSLHIGVRLGL